MDIYFTVFRQILEGRLGRAAELARQAAASSASKKGRGGGRGGRSGHGRGRGGRGAHREDPPAKGPAASVRLSPSALFLCPSQSSNVERV